MLNKGRKGVYSFVFGAITVSVVTPRSIEVINFSYEGVYETLRDEVINVVIEKISQSIIPELESDDCNIMAPAPSPNKTQVLRSSQFNIEDILSAQTNNIVLYLPDLIIPSATCKP